VGGGSSTSRDPPDADPAAQQDDGRDNRDERGFPVQGCCGRECGWKQATLWIGVAPRGPSDEAQVGDAGVEGATIDDEEPPAAAVLKMKVRSPPSTTPSSTAAALMQAP